MNLYFIYLLGLLCIKGTIEIQLNGKISSALLNQNSHSIMDHIQTNNIKFEIEQNLIEELNTSSNSSNQSQTEALKSYTYSNSALNFLKSYSQEIQNIEPQAHQMYISFSEVVTDTGDSIDDSYLTNSLAISFVILFGCAIGVFYKDLAYKVMKPSFRNHTLKWFREALWMTVIFVIIYLIANVTDGFGQTGTVKESVLKFTYCLIIFTILYLLLYLLIVKISEANEKIWMALEEQLLKSNELYQEYQTLHVKMISQGLDSNERHVMKAIKNKMEYFVLRQQFILPTYLPNVGENYLRYDFPFAEYLSKNVSRNIYLIFKLKLHSIISLVIVASAIMILGYYVNDDVEAIIILQFVPFFLFFNIVLLLYFQSMLKKLKPSFSSPYELDVLPFQVTRHSNKNMSRMRIPDYLYSQMVKAEKLGSFSRKFIRKTNPHQDLFLLKSPGFVRFLLNFLIVGESFFLSLYLLYYLSAITSGIEISLGLIYGLFIMFIFIYLFPETIKLYSICTSIEMMKNGKLISMIVSDQKKRRAEAFNNFYRMLKLFRKEAKDAEQQEKGISGSYEPARLQKVIIDLLRETFKRVENEEDAVSSVGLLLLTRLLGRKLPDQEFFFFLKYAMDKNDRVNFMRLASSVESITLDVALDPKIGIYEILSQDFENGNITVTAFKEYLIKAGMLSAEDIQIIVQEVQFLQSITTTISAESVALLARDSIEGHPR